jgi:hypothetical protein
MRISAKILKNVIDINHFSYANQFYMSGFEGETEAASLYIQLIDLDQDSLRYVPSTGATLNVIFPALGDNDVEITTTLQPFVGDLSIWKIDVPANNEFISSGNVIFSLTESSQTKRFVIKNALIVQYADQGGC